MNPTLSAARLRLALRHMAQALDEVTWDALPIRSIKHPDFVAHTGKTQLGLRRSK